MLTVLVLVWHRISLPRQRGNHTSPPPVKGQNIFLVPFSPVHTKEPVTEMSLHHTPPNKFSSDTNIHASVVSENFINTRKRKQPESEHSDNMDDFRELEEKFNLQLSVWDKRIAESLTSSVESAVSSAVNKEMSNLTATLSELNKNITKLSSDNIMIRKSLEQVNMRLTEIEKSQSFSSERQDCFDTRLKTLESNVTNTAKLNEQINLLECKIATMEQQARQTNLEICNLPERRGENLIGILECLGNLIKLPIQSSDVVAVHRVPHADNKSTRPKNIVVKLASRVLRDNIISACRLAKGLDSKSLSINGPQTAIYVNEHLTLGNKILFRQCREIAKKQGYKYVWVKHGIILLRKSDTSPVIAVRSVSDINRIK